MRRISSLFFAACLCISVVGCGGETATTDAPETSAPAEGGDGSAPKEEAEAGGEGEAATEEAAAE